MNKMAMEKAMSMHRGVKLGQELCPEAVVLHVTW